MRQENSLVEDHCKWNNLKSSFTLIFSYMSATSLVILLLRFIANRFINTLDESLQNGLKSPIDLERQRCGSVYADHQCKRARRVAVQT